MPVAISIGIFLLVLGIGLKATPRDATHQLQHHAQLVGSLAAIYACGSRHSGIALAIAHANFPGENNVPPAVLLCLIAGTLVAIPYLQCIRG